MGGGNSRLWNAQKTNNNICGTLVTENSILKTKHLTEEADWMLNRGAAFKEIINKNKPIRWNRYLVLFKDLKTNIEKYFGTGSLIEKNKITEMLTLSIPIFENSVVLTTAKYTRSTIQYFIDQATNIIHRLEIKNAQNIEIETTNKITEVSDFRKLMKIIRKKMKDK